MLCTCLVTITCFLESIPGADYGAVAIFKSVFVISSFSCLLLDLVDNNRFPDNYAKFAPAGLELVIDGFLDDYMLKICHMRIVHVLH